jgi:hypothetical protein
MMGKLGYVLNRKCTDLGIVAWMRTKSHREKRESGGTAKRCYHPRDCDVNYKMTILIRNDWQKEGAVAYNTDATPYVLHATERPCSLFLEPAATHMPGISYLATRRS